MYIAAGEAHSIAITEQGKAFSWGVNELCQLGVGDDKDRNAPTQLQGQQLTVMQRKVLGAAAGSQHSILLARKTGVVLPAPAPAK